MDAARALIDRCLDNETAALAAEGITVRDNPAAFSIPGGPWDYMAYYTDDDSEGHNTGYGSCPTLAAADLVKNYPLEVAA